MPDHHTKLQQVLQRIRNAEQQFQRSPESVELLAVSKTKSIVEINKLAEQGQTAFGESYLQEALEKMAIRPDLEWHFIGPIQSNKTKPIAEQFNWIHSVDRLKIARRLSDQRPESLADLNILLQVNISAESSKSGFHPAELLDAALEINTYPGLVIRGIMAIPQAETDFELQREAFKKTQALFLKLKEKLPQIDTLSIGMSADLEAAIAEGSTLVRVGTDLFGARNDGFK